MTISPPTTGKVQVNDVIVSVIAMIMEREDLIEREAALVEVGQALDNSLTEEALIDRVIHVAGEVLRFQACSVFLHDSKTDTFVLRGSSGSLRKQVGELSYCRDCSSQCSDRHSRPSNPLQSG